MMRERYRQGVKDRAEGRPYPKHYERWTPEGQQSYERGRLAEAARQAAPEPGIKTYRYLTREMKARRI